jgi:hypothetical protein
MSEEEFESVVTQLGGRLTTDKESRLFHQAVADTDAKIARQH